MNQFEVKNYNYRIGDTVNYNTIPVILRYMCSSLEVMPNNVVYTILDSGNYLYGWYNES